MDATGYPQPTYSLDTYPDGMTINSTTGVIDWTPDSTDPGVPVVVRASNGESPDDTQSFSISVEAAPPPEVEIIGSWTTGFSHTAEAGSNRVLIFTAHAQDNQSAGSYLDTVTYGGQSMTEIQEEEYYTNPYHYIVSAWVLDEAGIAAASNSNFVVSWSDGGPSNNPGYSSVFLQNVDQTTPIGASDENECDCEILSTGALATSDGDMVLLAAFHGGNSASSTNYECLNAFTEALEFYDPPDSGEGMGGYKAATGVSETPSVDSQNNNYSGRQALVGFVVQAAAAGPSQYSLNPSSTAGGSVTAPGEAGPYIYDAGTVVTLTAEAETGYHFVNWTGETDGIANVNSDNTTVTMNNDYTIQANFAIDTFTLDYAAGSGGSLTGETAQVVDYGSDGTAVTAVPDLGYHFVDWSDASTDNPRTDTNVTANVNVTATFTEDQYTLTINTVGSSSVTKAPDQATYTYGTVVTLTAIADVGWTFSEWSGDLTGSTNPDIIAMDGNKTVTATFTEVLPSDNFDDNKRGAMWRLFVENYDNARVVEDANRLNVRAIGDVNDLVAFYTANGWSFDVAEDFEVKVDFHYSHISSRDGRAGMTVENDDGYASISAGCDGNESYFYYETIVDGNTVFEQEIRDSNDGTLYISYDADSNNLYLSHVGYGSGNAYIWQTISNPLQVQWTSPVGVAIGGGSDSVVLSSGEAYLDDFEVTAGTLLGWPPVTDLNGDGFIGLGDIAVMSDHWLEVGPDVPGDIHHDDNNIVNLLDFAEFAVAW